MVVHGFQGAASDPEKLSLTDSLIDAVCLLTGISAGSWFDLQASWAYADGTLLVSLASILFIQLVGPGVILLSAALWQLLPWVGVGLLVIVELCRTMLSELLFIWVAGLLNLRCLLGILLSGLPAGLVSRTSFVTPGLLKCVESGG